jgi:hypothetical protein
MPKTEVELGQELSEAEREHAKKYPYSHYWFYMQVKDKMNGYKNNEISRKEFILWMQKLINEI